MPRSETEVFKSKEKVGPYEGRKALQELDHEWFYGWLAIIASGWVCEKDGEMISVVIMVENGGHGGEVAAPIARKIFQLYFENENLHLAKS